MKDDINEARRLLKEGLSGLGISCGEETLGRFMLYLSEMLKWSRIHNLTAIRDARGVVIKHFLDGALYLKALGPETKSIADVGSGVGVPGIVMKLLRPELTVCLIEPASKKAAFLRHMIRVLNLRGITVMDKRIEDASGIEVDAAVTRALYEAGRFCEKSDLIVRPGGLFILSKGPKADRELIGLKMAHEVMSMGLPFSDGAVRNIIIIHKDAA